MQDIASDPASVARVVGCCHGAATGFGSQHAPLLAPGLQPQCGARQGLQRMPGTWLSGLLMLGWTFACAGGAGYGMQQGWIARGNSPMDEMKNRVPKALPRLSGGL